jgi:hypothetical protein
MLNKPTYYSTIKLPGVKILLIEIQLLNPKLLSVMCLQNLLKLQVAENAAASFDNQGTN